MKCTGTTTQKAALYSDALMSYASPQTGESVNIYKAVNYSEDNPLYVIKGLDARANALRFYEVLLCSQTPKVCYDVFINIQFFN